MRGWAGLRWNNEGLGGTEMGDIRGEAGRGGKRPQGRIFVNQSVMRLCASQGGQQQRRDHRRSRDRGATAKQGEADEEEPRMLGR